MSFKENLLKKIKIDKMARQAIASIGPVDSGRKIDKKIMRELLEMTGYTYKRKRDLDLYIEDIGAEKTRILVLDNDLAIYNTSVYDVAMRKSPTVKEMMNPFNVVKILKDTDVVISKKEINFTDNGPGVPPSRKEEIFQPFVTTKPPGEGKGLGLYISREIAKYHGASIYMSETRAVHKDRLNTFILSLEATGE